MNPEINNAEVEALTQLRQRIADILPNLNEYQSHDLWLLRWLRARELNLAKSEDMLRKSLKWREVNGLEEILKWKAPDHIDQHFPVYTPGFDKDGCFVSIVPFGAWDIRKACSMGLKAEVVKYVGQLFENLMKFLEYRSTKEKFFSQFVIILDYGGFSLKQLTSRDTLNAIDEIVKNFEANYPETLKTAYVVNAPKYFEILFAIIKPLLTARTMSKISVHGSSGWRDQLLAAIDPDQLPSSFGGSNTTCAEYKVRYGFNVFKTYETFPDKELIGVVVDAGFKHSVENKLSKGDSLSWNFKTDLYDIGYSLQFTENLEDKPEILFSCENVDSHLHLQRGAIIAEKPGNYTLILDNSNSRFRGKNLYYAVRVKSGH